MGFLVGHFAYVFQGSLRSTDIRVAVCALTQRLVVAQKAFYRHVGQTDPWVDVTFLELNQIAIHLSHLTQLRHTPEAYDDFCFTPIPPPWLHTETIALRDDETGNSVQSLQTLAMKNLMARRQDDPAFPASDVHALTAIISRLRHDPVFRGVYAAPEAIEQARSTNLVAGEFSYRFRGTMQPDQVRMLVDLNTRQLIAAQKKVDLTGECITDEENFRPDWQELKILEREVLKVHLMSIENLAENFAQHGLQQLMFAPSWATEDTFSIPLTDPYNGYTVGRGLRNKVAPSTVLLPWAKLMDMVESSSAQGTDPIFSAKLVNGLCNKVKALTILKAALSDHRY
ncbi:hypothetical protein YA0089_18935 [Pseudomonas viridiflava]|uniref:hypothetical protein n=1 Tax=Pseudomonas viridiflava TaxID=33069 RepID=UPI0018E5E2B5|nr:hypothetical protein [Pseudomonas viridiflava]MBI6725683.1 hypothetical protein [Pseudomonas viridiflava]